MITLHSFREMAERHRAGEASEAAKVPLRDSYFRVVQEITAVLLGLAGYTKEIPQAIDINQQEIDWLLAMSDDINFMHYLGGNVCVCQTVSDLAEVTSMDIEFGKLHGRWPSLLDKVVLPWDDCRYILNADGSSDYALLFAATNNAGGPSWFIPKSLWQAAQIDQQIEAHQQFWSNGQ